MKCLKMQSSSLRELLEEHPRQLISALCKQFYSLGWVSANSGGLSIKYKERIKSDDLFVQDINGTDLQMPPSYKGLKKSQFSQIYMLPYKIHNAGAVIHAASQHAVTITLFWAHKAFRCTHLEMIKGIYDEEKNRYLRYDEKLVVPIIENSSDERNLTHRMYTAMMECPGCSVILIRRHGFFVWGKTLEATKTMAECYDYLFSLAVKMTQGGINPEKFEKF